MSLLLLIALLLWQALSLYSVAPYPLGFFNALIGGARNGWRYLADSNTDWGQGYQALADFQAARDLGPVRLAAFLFYDPARYGVAYTPLPPLGGDTPAVFPARFAPPPGDYVISTTPLAGIPLADPEMYDWFRWREPDARLAHALFYYRVSEEEAGVSWVAQCVRPVAPLTPEALRTGFGATPARVVDFDCTQSWVVPATPPQASPGTYAIHGALLEDTLAARLHYAPPAVPDPFLARRLAATEIVYRQRAYRDVPAFALYRQPAGTLPAPLSAHDSRLTRAWAAPAATPPAALAALPPLEQPDVGVLTFLGATVAQEATALEVTTWWRVSEPPGAALRARPLSVMGHLLTGEGESVGVADGLGYPAAQWQAGDVFAQRHRFPAVEREAGAAYYVRTGVYWLDNLERWPVAGTGAGADALFVRLGEE